MFLDDDVKDIIAEGRQFLKPEWKKWKMIKTDQGQGIPVPQMQKPYSAECKLIDLLPIEQITCGKTLVVDAIKKRVTRRKFDEEYITYEELSYLLWATQGVREKRENRSLRTVPSAGARHCFETYLFVNRVSGLEQGLYRYLPFDNKLCLVSSESGLEEKLSIAMAGNDFDSAVVFIWTAIPYRMEWRYSIVSHKMIAIDAGHVCQNLYLACESIVCGCCAVGAYSQNEMDALLEIDGEEEFTIYAASVGKCDK